MQSFNYRNASLDDLPRLLELEQKLIESERPSDADIKPSDALYYDLNALLSDANTQLKVIESAGEVIGTGYAQLRESLIYHQHSTHCYLGFIYVEPEHRGKGLARRMLNELTRWANDQGVHKFYLDVYSANTSAIRAYEKAGFKQVVINMELDL